MLWKSRIDNATVDLYTNDAQWKLNTILFAGGIVLIAENEKKVQKLAKEYNAVYQRRQLKADAKKGKLMVFEMEEHKVVEFAS